MTFPKTESDFSLSCPELHTLLSQLCPHLWQSTVNYIPQSLLQVAESKVKRCCKKKMVNLCMH